MILAIIWLPIKTYQALTFGLPNPWQFFLPSFGLPNLWHNKFWSQTN